MDTAATVASGATLTNITLAGTTTLAEGGILTGGDGIQAGTGPLNDCDGSILYGDGHGQLGRFIVFGSDGTMSWSSTINFNNNGTATFTGAVTVASIKVGSNQIVGAQGAAVANATDAASVITQLNALLARLRTHGLIAP